VVRTIQGKKIFRRLCFKVLMAIECDGYGFGLLAGTALYDASVANAGETFARNSSPYISG
jgi:hypothetical protein